MENKLNWKRLDAKARGLAIGAAILIVVCLLALASCDSRPAHQQQYQPIPGAAAQQPVPAAVAAAPAPVIVNQAPVSNGMTDMLLGSVIGHMIGSSNRAAPAPAAAPSTHTTTRVVERHYINTAPAPSITRPAPTAPSPAYAMKPATPPAPAYKAPAAPKPAVTVTYHGSAAAKAAAPARR